MRTARRILAALVLPVVVLVPAAVGAIAAILFTPPGQRLLARVATQWITRAVSGSVEIGEVGGNLVDHIELGHVVIRDSAGVVVLSSSHIAASYVLPQLLAHRLVFHDVGVDSLVLHLVRLRAGHWNYEKVFHLGEGPDDGKPPPTIAINTLRITNGQVRVDAPATPDRPNQPASRHARPPAQPRLEATADGLVRVYTFSDLNTTLRLLRISTPRRDPILAAITTLRFTASDPHLTVTQLAGRILTAGDTLRFAIDSVSLPGSRFMGTGAVRWPHDTVRFDFALDAPRVALRDLWWIDPNLPEWQGRGHVVATSYSGSRTDYRLEDLVLGTGAIGVAGKVTLQVERVRGLGMRGVDLQLRNTPIDVLRPYLDTLPVSGALTGHLLADGFLDSLRLGGDLVYADHLVAGAPTSHLRIDGTVHFGGPAGAVFQQFRLSQSSVALATVHQLVPSVVITGALRLTGRLDGPWQDADYLGTVEHVAPDSAISRMVGRVRLDSRAPVLGLALDADFDQLSFNALRSGYPALRARGGLTGHVVARGNLDSLDVDANVTGEIGTFRATGRVKVDAPDYGADSLVVVMQRLDLQAVTDSGMSTALNGQVTLHGAIDSGVPPRGVVTLALDRSRFGGATVDAVTGVVRADHGMLTVDTGSVIWPAGRIDARGTLGWAAPDSGTLSVAATVTSLAPFDSLVRAITGLEGDSLHPHPLDGQATASLQVTGSVDAPSISGIVDGSALVFDDWHANRLHAILRADSLGVRGLTVSATIDTAGVGVHVADRLQLRASGRPDSLRIAGSVHMVALDAGGGGSWTRRDSMSVVQLDSLRLDFPRQGWRLARPARITLAGAQFAFDDTLRLTTRDGSGSVRVSGTTPGSTPATLDATARGLDLLDIFGVLQRDTTALGGWGSLDLHLAGTRDAPVITGSAVVTSPVVDDLHAPSLQATFNYADRRLRSEVSLWTTGEKIFDGTISLPLDLALASRANRKLDGPLQIQGTADSVDMVMLAAFIPGIGSPTGMFSLKVAGNGTWAAPGLQGRVSIFNGGMFLPSLNVRYAPINGVARFTGDSLQFDSLRIGSGDGSVRIDGAVRFAELAKPVLDLTLHAGNFFAIDVPNFATLRVSGDVKLTGPLLQPVLTGSNVSVAESVVYFGDLLTKNVIDLDDPGNAALIDLTALQREQLRAQFSNRFLDSLRINGLQLRIANDVWLRSAEANIEVQGTLQVSKTRKVYALTGTLDAPRGTYTLRIGPINSGFVVDQGTVTYYGTSDLDALLNVQAHHQVRTLNGDDFNVVATITGSILAPKVDLSSPGRALSDRDLASYVLFGQSEAQLTSAQPGNGGAASAAVAALTGLLSSELQRSVLNGGSRSLTSLTIRPGIAPGAASAATQFAAGWQFGRWFVTFDAGVCLSQGSSLQKRNFGASLEYRISRAFRFQAAAEPVQTCATNLAADVFTTLSRYQLGWNFLWSRDY